MDCLRTFFIFSHLAHQIFIDLVTILRDILSATSNPVSLRLISVLWSHLRLHIPIRIF